MWTPGSWFYDPGIVDLKTGRVTMIPTDAQGDQYAMNWTHDGQVMSIVAPLRAGIWKFTPGPR